MVLRLLWAIVFLISCVHVFGDERRPLSQMRGGNLQLPRKFRTIDISQDPNPLPNIEDLDEYVTTTMLDEVLDQIIGTNDGLIIHRYHPAPHWLWRQWRATVFYHTIGTTLRNMSASFIFCIFLRKLTHGDWKVWDFPDIQNPRIARLRLIQKIWENFMTLTTFTLTFFVGQAYLFWRTIYETGRALQAKMNDINFLLAIHAHRKKNGTYTKDAQALLEQVASLLRIFHVLTWATHARRFRILLTDKGLARMVTRGIMSIHEKETMEMQMGLSKTERQYVLLVWMLHKCHHARKMGVLDGGEGLEHSLLEKVCMVRSLSTQFSDKMSGRMPLAYLHLVQILVDSFLLCAPLAQ